MLFIDHPYYVGVQYHPEYLSRPVKPSPPYLGLILASAGKLDRFLAAASTTSVAELLFPPHSSQLAAGHVNELNDFTDSTTGDVSSNFSFLVKGLEGL